VADRGSICNLDDASSKIGPEIDSSTKVLMSMAQGKTTNMRTFRSLIALSVPPVVLAGRARFLSFAPKSTAKTTKS
jgi:hypothetical protein